MTSPEHPEQQQQAYGDPSAGGDQTVGYGAPGYPHPQSGYVPAGYPTPDEQATAAIAAASTAQSAANRWKLIAGLALAAAALVILGFFLLGQQGRGSKSAPVTKTITQTTQTAGPTKTTTQTDTATVTGEAHTATQTERETEVRTATVTTTRTATDTTTTTNTVTATVKCTTPVGGTETCAPA